MATRTATIIMRMDTSDAQAGAQRMSAAQRQMVTEAKAANAELASATKSAPEFSVNKASSGQELAFLREKAAYWAQQASDTDRSYAVREAATKRYMQVQRAAANLEANQAQAAQAGAGVQAAITTKRTVDEAAGLRQRLAAQQAAGTQAVGIEREQQQERTAAARQGAAQRAGVEGGVGGGGAGGGHWYAGLGGKRIVKQELKYAAAMAIGAHSPELGLASMGLMSGGPAGLIAAGVATVSALYQQAREEANKLAEAQERHTDSLREAAKWASKLYQAPTTRLGGALRERAESLDQQVADMDKARRKEDRERGNFAKFATWVEAGGLLGHNFATSHSRRRNLEDADRRRLAEEAQRRREQARAEDAYENSTVLRGSETKARQSEIQLMGGGPAQRKAELKERQRAEVEGFDAETEETMRAMKLAGKSVSERNAYVATRNKQMSAFDRTQAAEKKKLGQDEQHETAKERQSANEAEIQARTEGYARERALMKSRHEWERSEYDRAGRDKTELIRKQLAEEEALRRDQLQINVHMIRQAEADHAEAYHAIKIRAGEMTSLQSTRLRLLAEYENQTHQKPDQSARLAIEAKAQGEYEKGISGVVQAHQEKLESPLQRLQRLRENLFGKRDAKGNLVMERDAAGQTRAVNLGAVGLKMLKPEVAAKMMEKEALETWRSLPQQPHGGRFTDAGSHWKDVQSSLSASENVPKEIKTLLLKEQDENMRFRTDLMKALRDGLLK